MIANRSAAHRPDRQIQRARRPEDAGAFPGPGRDPPLAPEEGDAVRDGSRRRRLDAVQNEYLRLAASAVGRDRAAGGAVAEGPRHLRSAGIRLMPTADAIERPPRRAAGVFRPHRGRGLGAPDLRRAGRPHPRDGARRARPDARARCSSWLPADLRGSAAARCRLRHRRAGGGGGAARAHVVAASICRRRWSNWRASGCRTMPGSGASISASATCSIPRLGTFDHVVAMDSLIHYRAARHGARARRDWRRAPTRSMLFTFAPRTPMLTRDACGGPAVPARRPRAGDRAGADRDDCRGADRGATGDLAAWRLGRTQRVTSGFYISQAMELVRAMNRTAAASPSAWIADRHASSCRSPMPRRRNCRWRGCCGCRCSRCRSAWRWCC